MTADTDAPIAFQGALGANSDIACRTLFPGRPVRPCDSFEETLGAVADGSAELAVIPIENSSNGRVADVHHLLPRSRLKIVAEHFQPIHHQLLALPGVRLDEIRQVRSHVQALGQCRRRLRALGLTPVTAADTAGAAAELAAAGARDTAVLASTLAAEIYGLDTLIADIEDAPHNATRFVVLARAARMPPVESELVVTSLVFRVRNVPAALYKALGGFATNGVNMTKLESYMVAGSFAATEFYCDVEGHPDERRVELALEELRFFTREVTVLGVYLGHPDRKNRTQVENPG